MALVSEGDLQGHLRVAFPTAAQPTITSLLGDVRRRAFRPGETVPEPSSAARWSNYLVVAGQVAVLQSADDGRQAVLHVGAPGRFFGLPPEDVLPSPLTLVGLTAGGVASWTDEVVAPLASSDVGFASDLLAHASLWIMALIRRVQVMTFDSALQRLANTFLDHGDLTLDAAHPALTRPQLAEVLGASREMTSRVITQLEATGAIARVGRSGIVMLDLERLRQATRHGDD
jgi:CRP-like cAMP-binding protein